MIQYASIQSKCFVSSDHLQRFRGHGIVSVTPDSDILSLKAGSEIWSIEAPGHTFHDGDEVFFEYINGTFFLEKHPSSNGGEVLTIPSDNYTNRNVTATLPSAELITSILKSLDTIDNSTLILNYLQQLPSALSKLPPSQLLDKLWSVINSIITSKKPVTAQNIEQLRHLLDIIKGELQQFRGMQPQPNLMTFIEKQVPSGMYLIDDSSEIHTFLECENSNLKEHMKGQIEKNGFAAIRAFATDNECSGVVLFDKSDLINELKTFLQSAEKKIPNFLSLSLLEKFIYEKRCFDQPFLSLLSKLPFPDMQFCTQVNTSHSKAEEAKLLHWLITLYDNPGYARQLAERLPLNCVTTIKNILPDLQVPLDTLQCSIGDIGIIPESIGKNTPSTIIKRLHELGSTLESDLLHNRPVQQSLKTELLNLLHYEKNSGTPTIPDAALQIDVRGIDTHADGVTNKIIDLEDNLRNLLDTIDATQTNNNYPATHPSHDHLALATSRQSYTPHLNLQYCIDKCMLSFCSVTSITKTIPKFNFLHDLISTLQIEIADLKSFFEKEHVTNSAEKQHQLSFFNQKITELYKTHGQFRSALNELLSDASGVQKPAEALLNRLESLQLLSRQIITQEGTNQIIALPVKIGQEWTEVTLRLVKKENTNRLQKSNQKHFTIYLDTAPSRLGEIQATFSYEKGRNLSILMQFEHKEVSAWFAGNCEHIRKILQNYGIHFVSIDFKTLLHDKKTEQKEVKTNDSNIDIKI